MPQFIGVKRLGCNKPNCQPCAILRARAKALGPTNVYVAVTKGELARLKRTPGLEALAQRVATASTQCAARVVR